MSGNIEILKECPGGKVSYAEWNLISGHVLGMNDDQANGFIAFALNVSRRDEARDLVDMLNDLSEQTGGWYLGDEDEEYVFVN